MQITQTKFQSSHYPDTLRQIENAPKLLYCLGELPKKRGYIAIVGTRKSTSYGRQAAFQLGAELARAGFVIVSGLAYGIDAAAHAGALDAGGLTVAVQARGLDGIYPSSNRDLARRILAGGGAIISEYGAGTPPLKHHFPERNRIVAGLSLGVIVVESGASGGSMLTVDHAKKANRTIMAVPGPITKESSAGCNNLIHDGAAMIRNSTDVLEAIGLNTDAIPLEKRVTAQSPQEAKLLELMMSGTSTTQELIEASELSAADFANIISLMEITGKVRNLGAGNWAARV